MVSERPWAREELLLLVLGVLLSWCVGSGVGIALVQFLPGSNPASMSFYRFVVSTLSFDVATILLIHQFLKLHESGWADFLGLSRPHLGRAILLAVIAGVLVLPVVLALNGFLLWFINSLSRHLATEEPAMKILKSTVGTGRQVYFGVAAILMAPVAEESLFRGILYPCIKQMGYPRLAMWVTSIVFGAIHMNMVVFIPLTLLGFVLIFVYEKTDKLIAPIATHALFNGVNFFFSIDPDLGQWLHRLKPW